MLLTFRIYEQLVFAQEKRIQKERESLTRHGYPVEKAARVAVAAVKEFLKENPGKLELVLWVLFDERTKLAYDAVLGSVNEDGVGIRL